MYQDCYVSGLLSIRTVIYQDGLSPTETPHPPEIEQRRNEPTSAIFPQKTGLLDGGRLIDGAE